MKDKPKYQDRNGKQLDAANYLSKLAAVETHILRITVALETDSLVNGITVTPHDAGLEIARRIKG